MIESENKQFSNLTQDKHLHNQSIATIQLIHVQKKKKKVRKYIFKINKNNCKGI